MVQHKYLASLDQGTSSTRFIVFTACGEIVAKHQISLAQRTAKHGWVSHSATEMFSAANECIEKTVSALKSGGLWSQGCISTIGITNQRETSVAWHRATGDPLCEAIVWLDKRTDALVAEMVAKATHADAFKKICGLPICSYFSAVKYCWMLRNVASVAEAAKDSNLMFGTVDSWLLYKLTGGVNGGVYKTDVTNASRTMLMDIKSVQWDQSMCTFFGIDARCLPEIASSSEIYGCIAEGSLKGVTISGIIGDQHAALVGQLCLKKGDLKNTYGTGCFMLCNTGETPLFSKHGLLTTIAYQLGPNAPVVYALEGSVAIAGAAISFLRDNLEMITEPHQVGELAGTVESTNGVYFVPAFSGLFAPYWRSDAKGTITGMTQSTRKPHICRSVLEAISHQTCDIINAMSADLAIPIKSLTVDGGVTNSDIAMQIQADFANIVVNRPQMNEATSFGAALIAARATGLVDFDKFEYSGAITKFKPAMSEDVRRDLRNGWHDAVQKSLYKSI